MTAQAIIPKFQREQALNSFFLILCSMIVSPIIFPLFILEGLRWVSGSDIFKKRRLRTFLHAIVLYTLSVAGFILLDLPIALYPVTGLALILPMQKALADSAELIFGRHFICGDHPTDSLADVLLFAKSNPLSTADCDDIGAWMSQEWERRFSAEELPLIGFERLSIVAEFLSERDSLRSHEDIVFMKDSVLKRHFESRQHRRTAAY